MFKRLIRPTLYLILALTMAFLVSCGSSEETDSADDTPFVRFVTPHDGDSVSSPVEVIMEAGDFTIEPSGEVNDGAGHFHIMVDTDCVETGEIIPSDEMHLHYGQAQTETELELESGEHTLCLQVGDGIHTALDITDVIQITVE